MRIGIFAIHDSATKAFAAPFFMQHADAALRAFSLAVNDKGHSINQSPGDYTLHQLGWFDDSSGNLIPESRQIASGLALYRLPVVTSGDDLAAHNGSATAN